MNGRFVYEGKAPDAPPPGAKTAVEKPAQKTETPETADAKAKQQRENTLNGMGKFDFGNLESILTDDVKNNISKVTRGIKNMMESLNTTLEQIRQGVVADRIRQGLVDTVRGKVGQVLAGGQLDPAKITPDKLKTLLENMSGVMGKVEYSPAENKIKTFRTGKINIDGNEYFGIYDSKISQNTIKPVSPKPKAAGATAGEEGEEEEKSGVGPVTNLDSSTNTVGAGVKAKYGPASFEATQSTLGTGVTGAVQGKKLGVQVGVIRGPDDTPYGVAQGSWELDHRNSLAVTAYPDQTTVTEGALPPVYVTWTRKIPGVGELTASGHFGSGTLPARNAAMGGPMGGNPVQTDAAKGGYGGGAVGFTW